jgi:dipeptidyl aminopeptidase/acylaminoacyl peptidase
VALHGGPIARWTAEYTGVLQLFAQLGLPVLALNYPGSTGSGQDHMRLLFGRAGTVDVDAVVSVVDALTSEEERRVILYGESYGAFLAHAVAAVRPCAGVITLGGFGSFSRLHQYGSTEIRDLLELLDGGNPLDCGRNLLTNRRTNRDKVLIAHGTADRTVPVAESRELARALRGREGAGEEDVRLVELDGQGHELFGRSVLEHWYREIANFVANLPKESRSPAQRVHQRQGR